jgi:hypothetical protein
MIFHFEANFSFGNDALADCNDALASLCYQQKSFAN